MKKNETTARLLAAAAICLASASALAHPGHGMEGAHWHATDSALYIALAVAGGVAVWLSLRK